MLTLPRSSTEKLLGCSFPEKYTVLGVDTASRSGYSKIIVDKKNIKIDTGIISIDSKDKYFKFNQMIPTFMDLTKGCNCVIVEDVFMKFNVNVHSFLARIGMIVYMSAKLNNVSAVEFVWASSARKALGLHGNAKKDIVQKEFCEKLNLKLVDEDIIDAIVLSFYGLIKKGEIFSD